MRQKLALFLVLTISPCLSYAAPAPFDSLMREVSLFSTSHSPPITLGSTDTNISLVRDSGTYYGDYTMLPKIQLQKGSSTGATLTYEFGQMLPPPPYAFVGTGTSIGITAYYPLQVNSSIPETGVRASYTYFDVPNHFFVNTIALDFTINKKISMITPYAGLGVIFMNGQYTGNPYIYGTMTHYILGASMNLNAIAVALEINGAESLQSTSLKVGYRF